MAERVEGAHTHRSSFWQQRWGELNNPKVYLPFTRVTLTMFSNRMSMSE